MLLRNAQTDLAIRIWTILVPIILKKYKKKGSGPFLYKFFVPIRVGLRAGFIVFSGLPLALLFYARALNGRTDGA